MAKKQSRHLSFIDTNNDIQLELHVGEKITHRYRAVINDAVRVRVPRPDPKKLLENMEYFAAKGLCDGTTQGCLAYYIQCCHNEISKQLHEIRKSCLRIERQLECIEISRRILKEL